MEVCDFHFSDSHLEPLYYRNIGNITLKLTINPIYAHDMGDLKPLAFDIETSGLGPESVITVAGIASEVSAWLVLNTGDASADAAALTAELESETRIPVQLVVTESEAELLRELNDCANQRVDSDRHYLTAYNGERWKSGFDLPFLRRSCVRHSASWPFPNVAYADVMTMIERIDTNDVNDLAGVYDDLIGNNHCDPFEDSGEAVTAYEERDWTELLLHNLADIVRTQELAVLAEQYVSKSDFGMKSLSPPNE